MSNTKHKKAFRLFWTNKWKYGHSPEQWIALCESRRDGSRNKQLLLQAVEKLKLEKLINPDERDNLLQMLKSSDPESMLLAITLMAKLKPKKFRR